MSNINKQQLREAAQQCSAQEPLRIVEYHGKMCLRNSGGIVFTVLRDSSFPEYSSENENYARLAELSNPATVLALLDELESKDVQIANLTAERDALREGEMGDARHSNTRAAADIYFQLVEECEIPAGGSLVEHIDNMRDELEATEKSNAFLKGQLAELANFNPDWDKLEAATYSLREHMSELKAARARIAELEAREVVLPSVQDVHPLGPQSAKIFCEFHRNIINRCADEIRKVGVNVSIKVGAPQLPQPAVVPLAVSWEDVPEEITEDDMDLASAWAHGFNQCRAAMLQGSEPVSQPYTLRDGWVAVPAEPTQEMLDSYEHDAMPAVFIDSMRERARMSRRHSWRAFLRAAPKLEVNQPPQSESENEPVTVYPWVVSIMVFEKDLHQWIPYCVYILKNNDGLLTRIDLEVLLREEIKGHIGDRNYQITFFGRVAPYSESEEPQIVNDESVAVNNSTKAIVDWTIKSQASSQDISFHMSGTTCRSDERMMEMITCGKHPMTAMRSHPFLQLSSYPPRTPLYCPECEPHVAEWEDRDKKLRKGKGV